MNKPSKLLTVLGGVALFVGVVVVLLIQGRNNLRRAILMELEESSQAILELKQGFNVAGLGELDRDGKAVKHAAITEQSIDILLLSNHPRDRLKSAEIATIGDLLKRTEADLLKISDFDEFSLDEVKIKLSGRGLALAESRK